MPLRRTSLAILLLALVACGEDPLGPGQEFQGLYDLQSIDGQENDWALSDAGSPVLVEVLAASVDLAYDLKCVMYLAVGETDMSDPLNWVQTIREDWAECTYEIEAGVIVLSFSPRPDDLGGDGEPAFLFPSGGVLSGSYSREDLPRGDNVFILGTISVVEEGKTFVYQTTENSAGGGPGCWFSC